MEFPLIQDSPENSPFIWKDVSMCNDHNNYKNLGCIKKLVNYIMKDKITGGRVRFCGGNGVDYIFYKNAYQQMKSVKKYFQKLSGRQIWHYVLSFPFPPSGQDSYTAYEIGLEVINTCFAQYQSLFAVHEDTDNLHIHFLVNSVSYTDGRKWHLTNWERNALKEYIQTATHSYFCSKVE